MSNRLVLAIVAGALPFTEIGWAQGRGAGDRGFSNDARSGGRRGPLASQLAVQLSGPGGFACQQILREVFCV